MQHTDVFLRIIALVFITLVPTVVVAGPVTSVYQYQSTVSTDANGALDLNVELNFDDAVSGAPIAVVMHGYSSTTGIFDRYRANAQQLRNAGFFVLTVAMRGREGSDGVRDSGGVEIHDIYDAVEAVKANANYSSLIDSDAVYLTGYSGGGGNVMSAITKMPDCFTAASAFFGMSDYGYNNTTGWYNNGASSSHQSIMQSDIGDPTLGDAAVADRYQARASNLASKNNPYTEIHLFVNDDEPTCPVNHSTSYRDNAAAAASYAGEFDNITVHIGDHSGNTYEDFDNDGLNDPEEQQNWPHTAPSADQQNAAEAWFLDRLLDGSISAPELNTSDELFVAGYVKTNPFQLWLGDGQNAAGDLAYSLSETSKIFDLDIASNDKTVTGTLDVDTTDMAGKHVQITLNGTAIDSFIAGDTYRYTGLGHEDLLELTVTPEPSTWTILAAVALAAALAYHRKRRNLAPPTSGAPS